MVGLLVWFRFIAEFLVVRGRLERPRKPSTFRPVGRFAQPKTNRQKSKRADFPKETGPLGRVFSQRFFLGISETVGLAPPPLVPFPPLKFQIPAASLSLNGDDSPPHIATLCLRLTFADLSGDLSDAAGGDN